jgi:hypothetical protein
MGLVVCVKVLSSEQELYVGGAPKMELKRVDIAEGVLPVHDDVHSVHIHGRAQVDEAILGCGAVQYHRSVLIIAIHCYSKVRDCRQQVGIVPAACKVVVVAIAYVLRQRRLRCLNWQER